MTINMYIGHKSGPEFNMPCTDEGLRQMAKQFNSIESPTLKLSRGMLIL